MTKEKKDVLERARKTFIETLVSTILGSLAIVDWTDPSRIVDCLVTVVMIPALATAFSAVWNILKPVILEEDSIALTEIDPGINPEDVDEDEQIYG